jgi:hypothetical protein
MSKYNIIYLSPTDDPYLWNGRSLDKLEHTGQEVLRFSGETFKEDELEEAIKACKEAAKQLFPEDKELEVKTIEIKVTD